MLEVRVQKHDGSRESASRFPRERPSATKSVAVEIRIAPPRLPVDLLDGGIAIVEENDRLEVELVVGDDSRGKVPKQHRELVSIRAKDHGQEADLVGRPLDDDGI